MSEQKIVINKSEEIKSEEGKIIKIDKQVETKKIAKDNGKQEIISKVDVSVKADIVKSGDNGDNIEIIKEETNSRNNENFDKVINDNHNELENNLNKNDISNNDKSQTQEVKLEIPYFNEVKDFMASENLTFKSFDRLTQQDYANLMKKITSISKENESKDLDIFSSIINLSKLASKNIQTGSKGEIIKIPSDIGRYIELFKSLKNQLLHSVTGSINLAVKEGKDLLTISLTPPELGRLKVSLTSQKEKNRCKNRN